MGRFIVIVLDSFGVGSMEDAAIVRPADVGANTSLHILENNKQYYWPTLEKLGLINLLPVSEINNMQENPKANIGKANLTHFGADSFAGHQEIMGTKNKSPLLMPIKEVLNEVEAALLNNGFTVERIEKEGQAVLLVNEAVIVADNMETDLGQVMNVSGTLDQVTFDEIVKIGRVVRSVVKVGRVIALGGRNVTRADLENALKVQGDYIGLDTPAAGLYKEDYHVIHLGYGVDETVQVPTALAKENIETVFVGKVGDIVYNPSNNNYSNVDSQDLFNVFIERIQSKKEGFFCLNIQETDLAGHAEDTARYAEVLALSDKMIEKVIENMNAEDILVVMADHGNDPTIGHAQHTREQVPLLIYKKGLEGVSIGERETMADVGATVADYFGTTIPYGTSFLDEIK